MQLSFASMHITSHRALDHLPPTVYATFRIGMAVPLLFISAGIQVQPCALSRLQHPVS